MHPESTKTLAGIRNIPTELTGKWAELCFYDRIMAIELFRLIGDEPVPFGPAWEDRLLCKLDVRLGERRAAKASIQRLVGAGLLTVVDEGTVQLSLEAQP